MYKMQKERKSERRKERIGAHRFEKVFSWFEKKNLSFASILLLFISSFIFISSCANNRKEKTASELLSLKDSFEDVKEFVLDEKTGQEIAKDQILIYIAGKDRADVENKKSKVSQIIAARKGEFSILGEIEFSSEKGGIGVLLQARVPAGTSEEIKEIVSEVGFAGDGIRAFPNMKMKPSAILGGYVPLDPLFDSWDETPGGNNWHFEAVNMPKLWNLETRGKVPVAVIDFGIRKHEDLEYDLRRGVDGEGADWAQNHGVSILGVLGAVGNNSKGIAGAIWRGDIKAYVIDGALSSLVQSIVLALQDKAKVILFAGGLEWGSVNPEGNPEAEAILEYHREIFSVVFQYVRYYDALFVQSAGNEGKDARWAGVGASVKDLFPQNILLVGSTNIFGKISTFSNRGKLVDLYLPGESIFTTCLGEGENAGNTGYCLLSGTSYSAALGAGAAVLLRSINRDLKSGDIKNLILSGVRLEGEGDRARYVVDFSVSGNLALSTKPGETQEIPEPLPDLPLIEDERGGYLAPKAVQCATYDNTTADGDPAYRAPKCPLDVEGCSSCGLLDGNDNSSTNPEPNNTTAPYSNNTLYGTCSDGAGTGANSPVRIISIQVESMAESGFIEPSKNIKVTVRAWCNNNAQQRIDVLYTQNADTNPPTFTYLGSYRCDCNQNNGWGTGTPVVSGTNFCSRSGNETTISFLMTLPTVTPPRKMAIRARIQNSNAWQTGACYTGSTIYDHDDLVFTVQNPPSSFRCGVYNSSFQAPVCYGDGWCGTCNLVPCRDTVNDAAESPTGFFQCTNGGREPNQPNTLFSSNPSLRCLDTDQNDPGQLDEQIRRINIKSLATSGKFEGGEYVEVSMLVACYPNEDQIIIAYGSGVTYSPTPVTNWRYITTIYCPQSGNQRYWHNLSYTLKLDNVEGWHAVRVVLGWCEGCSSTQTGICPSFFSSRPYRDADDFVFYVKAKPPSSLPVCAAYDNTTADGDPQYRAPKCPAGASICSTCDLVKSRDGLSGTSESGQPNTLFGLCADDGPATPGYLQTESIERIEIRDLSGSGTFQPGQPVEVSVLVYCDPTYPNYLNDYLIILYSSNADSPTFTRVLTATCTTAGYNLIRTNITLANVVGRHVIRAMFQQGAFSAGEICAGGGSGQDGDTDDLVFIVGVPQAPSDFNAEGVAPDAITLSWSDVQGETRYELRWTDTYNPDFSTWINHPASPFPANTTWYVDRPLPEGTYRCYALRACNSNGCSNFVWDCATVPSLSANCAVYDSTWRVPRCDGGVNNCSTCDLVVSRDSLPSRPEQNTPNAWYSSSCVDGSGGDWYSSRSIEKITLTTTESSFSPGYPISVTVRVFCSSTADYVHLYVSAGTSPISWSQAGILPYPPSQACTGSNRVEDKTFTFTPSANNWYVIRAVVTGSTASSCPGGSQDEVDDVAVRVGGVPPTPSGFDVIFVSPDIARVVWNDVAGETYYQLLSAPSPLDTFTDDTPHYDYGSPRIGFQANTTQHDHAGLGSGQTLCFKLRACNGIGCSAFTSVKCVTTAPNPPYSLRVTAYSTETMGSFSQYVVSFIDNSTNEDGFVIERTSDGSSWTRYEWWSNSTTKSGTGSRRIEFSLSSETRWCFRVASFKQNTAGTLTLSSWADNATRCVVGVRAPSNLYGEGVPAVRTLRFFWRDNSSYESGQRFEWRLQSSSTYTRDLLSANSEYYEKQFPSENVYCMRVTNWWVGSGTGSELGSYSQGYSGEICKLAMGVPSPLNVFVESGVVRLTWQDNAVSETGYSVEVSSGSGWSVLATKSPDTVTHAYTPANGSYCYRVRGVKGTNYSDYTEVVCASFGRAACSGLLNINVGGGNPINEAPLVDGDTIYLSFANRVYGIWKSGSTKWGVSFPTTISSNICSLSQDRIFVGLADGSAYIISKANGAILKSKSLGIGTGSIEGCAVSSKGEIFVATSGGSVYKLDPALNTLASRSAGSPVPVTAPAIDEVRGLVYVPRQDGTIFVYDMNLGSVGSVSLGTGVRSGVAIGPKGEIYVGGTDGYLYMVTRVGTSFYVKSQNVGGSIVVSPVVYQWGAEVTVVVGSDTGVVKAFRLDNNMNLVEIWSQTLAGGIRGSPVIVGDVVYLGVDLVGGGNVQGIKITDGSLVCSYSLGGGKSGSPLEVGGGDVVIGDSAGRLHIIVGGGEANGGGWWISYQMRGKRSVGSLYTTNRALAYEEARYCPYSSAPNNILFSVISAEIRSDYAGREIFAVNNTGTATRAYLISASGSIIWSDSVGQAVWSVPAVGNIDGDSQPEIVIGVDDGRVMVFGSNGFKAQISLCGKVRAVTLADVDENGDYEIIAVAKVCNRVYVLDWNGSSLQVLKRFDLASGSDNNSYAVWFEKFGQNIYVTGLDGKLYIFDYGTDTTTTVDIVLGYGLDTPAIGDVDGDGAKEVVFGGRDGKVYIRDSAGAPDGSVDLSSYVGSMTCFRVSLGDANNNGIDEIYVVATDCSSNTGVSYLISIERSGASYQVKWVRGPFGGVNVSHAVIADFDLDGVGEIAIITHDGTLYVYRYDGSLSFVGRYYFSGAGARGGISVIDVDGDGRQNLVFGDRAGCVHVFEFGQGTASGTIWWGYNRQNPKQNGVR
jgi:hypothetical protein